MSKLNEEVAVEVMGWEKRWSNRLDCECWMIPDSDTPPESQYIGYVDGYREIPVLENGRETFRPDQDRNQSRMVMNKAAKIIEEIIKPNYEYDDSIDVFSLAQGHISSHIRKHYPKDYWVTPEQECQAALMAVREARK